MSFKIELLKQEVGNDPVKKVGMIKEIVKSLALIPDSITQQVYIKESSKLLEISEQEILKEIRNSKSNILKRPKKTEEKTGDKPLNKVKAKTYHQEQNIIRFLLSYGVKEIEFLDVIEEESEGGFKRTREEKYSTSVAQFILEELDEEGVHFDDPDFQFIFNTFQTYFKKGEIIDQAYFLKHNQNNISQTSVNTIFSKYTLSEQWKEKHGIHTVTEDMQLKLAVESAIYAFKIIKIEVAIDKQREKLENLAIDEQIEVMKIIHTYLQIKKEISKKLGRIILK